MSTLFSNLTSEREDVDARSLMNSRLSFECPDFPVNMMYLNLPSTAASQVPELFSISSLQGHDYVDTDTFGEKKEEILLFAPPDRQLDFGHSYSDNNILNLDADLNLHHEGFSLSLGNQVLSSNEIASCENRFMNSGVSSILSSHVDQHSQSSDIKTEQYFSFDSSQSGSNSFNFGSICNHTSSAPPEDMVVGEMMYSSKYLNAVQEILDEVVNVRQCLKPTKKQLKFQSYNHHVSEESKLKCNQQSGVSLNPQNSSSPAELSPSQNDLCNKMTKLLSLLDEVDRKYKKYCQQMQCVVSSFEVMVGVGAARCYTALALQTISCQFRHMLDAIKKQIQVVHQSLGKKGTNIPNVQGARLSRLRYVDQQVRQERALQQFGMVRQPWRPQRGLPETAVSILRAWLFEHFLHPYPKDSEKIMLARKAGLTRSQVANWFINARVRLWKPMIEEMYKEEVGNIGMDFESSESPKAAKKLKSEPEDTGEVLHESFTTMVSDNGHLGKPSDQSRNIISSNDLEVNGYAMNYSFQIAGQEAEKMAFTVDNYNLSLLGGAVEDQVSLALGLQYSVNDTMPIFGVPQSAAMDTAAVLSAGMVKADYFCMDTINQQDRLYNQHMLLSNFVV